MPRLFALCLLLGMYAALAAPAARAGEIRFVEVQGRFADDAYVVSADLELMLGEDVLEALENGVPLEFVFDLRVVHPRRFLWDREILSLRRHRRIERHALADKYVVTDETTDKRAVFGSRGDALAALGRLADIPVVSSARLHAARPVNARLRAQLDVEALPAPLRPIAYLSPSWHMSSNWYTWSVME